MLLTLFRGLRLLRHPELVRRLGEIRSAELEIEAFRRANPGATVSSTAIVGGWREGSVRLAEGSRIEHGTIISAGDPHNGFGSLEVGARTWIGPYNNIRLAGGVTIRIGADCLISQFCTIVGANHQLPRGVTIASLPSGPPRHVTIGDDVWLGAGAVILPGVAIGDGAVIGAGSVVTRSVAPYEIWAGNPANRISTRT